MNAARAVCLLLGLAAAPPANAAAQEREPTDAAAGCYHIELGPWAPELQPVDAPYQIPPGRFRLHTRLGEADYERGKRIVRPVIDRGPGRTAAAYWERIGQDSIQVAWTNGFVGAWLRLRVAGDSLSGIARAFTDGGGRPVPEARVSGRRIDCAEASR